MKKLITICLLFFSLTTVSFGQTKEETISWLKEKMTNNLDFSQGMKDHQVIGFRDLELESINECEFILKYKIMSEKDQTKKL